MKNSIKLSLLAVPFLLASCGGSNSIKIDGSTEMTLNYIETMGMNTYTKTDITVLLPFKFPESQKDKYKITNDFDSTTQIKDTNINKSNINKVFFGAGDVSWLTSSSGDEPEVYAYQGKAQLTLESGKGESGNYVKFEYNPKLEKDGKVVAEGKMTITLKIA